MFSSILGDDFLNKSFFDFIRKYKLIFIPLGIMLFALVYVCFVRGTGLVYVANCFSNTYDAVSDDIDLLAKNMGYKKHISKVFIDTDNLFIEFNNGISMKDKRFETEKKKNDSISKDKKPKSSVNVSGFAKEIVDNYRYTADFFYSLDVKRCPSEYIILGDNKIKCKVYKINADAEKFMEYIRHIQTDNMKNFLYDRAEVVLNAVNRELDLDIPQSTIDEIIDNITPDKSKLENNVNNGIEIKIYIYKNKICRAYTSVDFDNLDVSNILVDVNLGDGKSILNLCEIHFGATINGKNLYIDLSGDGNIASKKSEIYYNVSSKIIFDHINSFKLSADLSYSGDEINLDGLYSVLMFDNRISGSAKVSNGEDLIIKFYDEDNKNAVNIKAKKG